MRTSIRKLWRSPAAPSIASFSSWSARLTGGFHGTSCPHPGEKSTGRLARLLPALALGLLLTAAWLVLLATLLYSEDRQTWYRAGSLSAEQPAPALSGAIAFAVRPHTHYWLAGQAVDALGQVEVADSTRWIEITTGDSRLYLPRIGLRP